MIMNVDFLYGWVFGVMVEYFWVDIKCLWKFFLSKSLVWFCY